MARNALTSELRDVTLVRELQMLARETVLLTRAAVAVTAAAGALIVRFGVAPGTDGRLRQVERPLFPLVFRA
jgi:hypothetical protein